MSESITGVETFNEASRPQFLAEQCAEFADATHPLPKHSFRKIVSVLFGGAIFFVIPQLFFYPTFVSKLSFLKPFEPLSVQAASFALYFLVCYVLLVGPMNIRFNFNNAKRCRMIANLISRTEKEFIISSGHFDSNLYSNTEVLCAIESALQRGVKFRLFQRQIEIDENSVEFIDLVRKYGIAIHHWQDGKHSLPSDFMISDMQHARVEFLSRSMSSNDKDKFAAYFYHNKRIAKFYFKTYIASQPIEEIPTI